MLACRAKGIFIEGQGAGLCLIEVMAKVADFEVFEPVEPGRLCRACGARNMFFVRGENVEFFLIGTPLASRRS